MRRNLAATVLAVALTLLCTSDASATVTQVDGTIVPANGNCQAGLNSSELGIDAILDAA